MTLFKQMGIAIAIIIITILASVMAINYQSTKSDMIQSVYETSVNNISTLAQTLSQAQGDEAYIRTIIDAAFDSGYYKRIEYHSNISEFSYQQLDKQKVQGVPTWFINSTKAELKSIKEDVVSGWEVLGEVKIVGDTGIIYKSLYRTFINLIYVFIGSVLISLVFLSVMLSFILRPLKEIQNQAEAITRDEFVIQEDAPYTTEFKDVVRGMNMMVKKVEYIFVKGSEALKRNQELLYIDPVTKLHNRRYLLLQLPELVALENRANGGTIILAGMSGAEVLNQELGHKEADEAFASLGKIFLNICENFEDGVSARVNGTEFSLMLPKCEARDGLSIAKTIDKEFKALLEKYNIQTKSVTLDIGIYRYKSNVEISDLLTRADNALTQAKADELSSTYIYEEKDDENAMGKEQWREIIEESIEHKHFKLKFWPMMETRVRKIDHNVMTFTIDDKEHKQYLYGDFIAPAINLGLVSKVYMVALKELMTNKYDKLENTLCCVRLSSEFIKDPLAFEALATLLKEHAKQLNFELAFEISDGFVARHPMQVKRFVSLFREYNCGFGIHSFMGASDDFTYLKEFNPRFIKADVSFLLDQSKDSMSALEVITDSLGIKIVAASVQTQEQLDRLRDLRIYRVQGPITQALIN